MRQIIRIGIALASVLVACDQGADPYWGPPERSSSAAADLISVQSCTSQAQTCAAGASTAAAAATCEQDLRACLSGLCSEAGVPSVPPFDAGALPPPPGTSFDAGPLPPLGGFDAGLSPLPDAGLPPVALPDAGLPPIVLPDASSLAGAGACIQALQACLASASDPMACASQVATCLAQAL